MNATAKEISKHAMKLSAKSRAVIADMLLESLGDHKSSDNEKQWLKEAKKRDQEISDGNVHCKTHDEVMKSIFEAI